MKKNFKKLMSVLLIAVMLCSIFSVSVSAAGKTITLASVTRKVNGETCTAKLNDMLMNLPGDTYTTTNKEGKTVVYTLDKVNHTITFETQPDGYFYFPENFFVMDGHEQDGWGTSKTSNGTANREGKKSSKITSNKTYYPRFNQKKYDVEFLAGANSSGEGEAFNDQTYAKKITVPGAIFERPGFVQIGWAVVDGSDIIDLEFGSEYKIIDSVKFYPVWQQVILNISHDINLFAFGSECEDYAQLEAKVLTITNKGNGIVGLTLPTSANYSIVAENGETAIPANGGSVKVLIQPNAGLVAGSYVEALKFDFGNPDVDFSVTVKFTVNKHLFIKYEPVGDATYTDNGHEIAECFSGCGKTDKRIQEGSKKVVSVDNNKADGLLKEYLQFKTVKFVAYGSGMDAAETDNISNRFRPTEWSVADTKFGGKFDANTTDYTVKYDHGDGNFGTYTLTIKFVEEAKDATTGEWKATGIEDVKTFEYSIGPSEKDNQEVVRPNMIVSIIFGLFGYLIDLLSSGSLF